MLFTKLKKIGRAGHAAGVKWKINSYRILVERVGRAENTRQNAR